MTETTPENPLNSVENEALRQEHEALISTPQNREIRGVRRSFSTEAESHAPLDHVGEIAKNVPVVETAGKHNEIPNMTLEDEIPEPNRRERINSILSGNKKVAGADAAPGGANSLAEELERLHRRAA